MNKTVIGKGDDNFLSKVSFLIFMLTLIAVLVTALRGDWLMYIILSFMTYWIGYNTFHRNNLSIQGDGR